jgi:hypothetical protein
VMFFCQYVSEQPASDIAVSRKSHDMYAWLSRRSYRCDGLARNDPWNTQRPLRHSVLQNG